MKGGIAEWRRRPKAGRRRAARSAKLTSPARKGGRPAPPFSCTAPDSQTTVHHRHAIPDARAPDDVPLGQSIDDVHPRDDAAQDRVTGIHPRLWRQRNEELAPSSFRRVTRQAHRAPQEGPLTHFVPDRVAGPSVAVATRVTASNEPVRHDFVKWQAVEIALAASVANVSVATGASLTASSI